MSSPSAVRIASLTAVLVSAWVPPAAGQESSIRLTGVPDRLAIPLPDGSNRVLTATVAGLAAKSVWLATAKDARLKVFLTKLDAQTYQINLADRDVAAVLRAAGARREFRIFAELEDKTIAASIPVRYSRSPRPVYERPARPFRFRGSPVYVHTDDGDAKRLGPGPHWLDPQAVTRIDVHLDNDAAATEVRADVGGAHWDFEPVDGDDVARLEITPEIRKRWQAKGMLHVQDARAPGWLTGTVLKAKPKTLAFPGNVATVTVHQRRSKAIPGSNGFLRIQLGDITAGQVLLTLQTAENKPVVDTRSIRRGESVRFTFGGQPYVLYVRKLVNRLIGDD